LYALSTKQLDGVDAVSPTVLRDPVQSGYHGLQRVPLAGRDLGSNQAHPARELLHVRQAIPPPLDRTDLRATLPHSGADLARQRLDAAGYDVQPTAFWYPTDPDRLYMTQPQKLFSCLSGRLSAVGLNIIAKPISWNAGGYLAQIMDNDGDRGLHLFGRNVYIRDPLYLLAELFEHPNREFGWHNTAVTQALADARVEDDTETRTGLLTAVEEALSLDLPAIPLAFPITALA